MDNTTTRKDIYNNTYNKIKINNKIITTIKIKKYKKKYVINVMKMSIKMYKVMLREPSKRTYIEKTQTLTIKKNKYEKKNMNNIFGTNNNMNTFIDGVKEEIVNDNKSTDKSKEDDVTINEKYKEETSKEEEEINNYEEEKNKN